MTATPFDPPIDVIRSPRRRKTVQARLVGERVELRVPAAMSDAEVAEHIATLVPKLERQRRASPIDLTERARRLARRFDLPQPD
ncbi:MAG: metal-dependent hydrolase, partial [Acidimicrobiia bacterium]|nr:metal-dependent hydrolase [Acidimicrobiia bacterium]